MVPADQCFGFIRPFLPQERPIDLPRIAGRELYEMATAKQASAGALYDWAWNEANALPPSWFSGLAILLGMVESSGGRKGLLDAYIAIIPKADGGSTPSGQRRLCVLPVVFRQWPSLRFLISGSGSLSQVFSVGNGVSSVDARFSTVMDNEEILSDGRDDQLPVLVASRPSHIVNRSIIAWAVRSVRFD